MRSLYRLVRVVFSIRSAFYGRCRVIITNSPWNVRVYIVSFDNYISQCNRLILKYPGFRRCRAFADSIRYTHRQGKCAAPRIFRNAHNIFIVWYTIRYVITPPPPFAYKMYNIMVYWCCRCTHYCLTVVYLFIFYYGISRKRFEPFWIYNETARVGVGTQLQHREHRWRA